MLKYFKIKNFKSIIETTVDFTYDESRSPSKEYLTNPKKELVFLPNNKLSTNKNNRIVPVSVFYGANASGKSNFIDSLKTFRSLVLGRFEPTKYQPNKLDCNDNSTTFEVCFIENNKKYEYKIEYNNANIIMELLTVGSKNIFLIENNNIKELNLTKNNKKNPYLQRKYVIDYYNSICKNNNFNIFSFLNTINNIPNTNNDIKIAFDMIKNIYVLSSNNLLQYPYTQIKELFNSKNNEINKTIITKYIKKFDIDIGKVEYDSLTDEYYTVYKNNSGENIRFDIQKHESSGTRILFNLIPVALNVLNKGQILVMDELENSLHTKILFEIVRMFKSKLYNKGNAQLIFTTHNTDLLDYNILRRTEINFLEKIDNKGTKIKRLRKTVRNTADFRKQYLEALYGVVPLIEE